MTPNRSRLPPRWQSAILPLLAGLVWCAAGVSITRRGIDPDELEHLHAAFCVSLGQVPYRDFFEHHGPALYWMAQPAFWIAGPTLDTLWLLRGVMWLCSTVTAFVVWRVGVRLKLGGVSWLVTLLLVISSVFFAKGIEFRPDVPATLLLTVALFCLLPIHGATDAAVAGVDELAVERKSRGRAVVRRVILALAVGGATLFTQKAIVPIAALAVAATWARWRQTGRLMIPATVWALAAGVGILWSVVWLGFSMIGAGGALFDSTVAQLIRWSVRSATWEHLRPTLVADFLVWGFSLFALIQAFRGRLSPPDGCIADASGTTGPCTATVREFVVMAATLCGLSLVVVKATFPQYYLLWFPVLSLSAGFGLECWSRLEPGWLRRASDGALFAGVVVQAGLLIRGWNAQELGPYSHIAADPVTFGGIAIAAVWVMVASGIAVWSRGIAARRSIAAVGLGLGYLIARDVDSACWSNSAQRAAIDQLHARVRVDQTVLDGFTGLAALRPHAYFTWWLNEFSLGLIPEERLEAELRELLESHPPAGILYDENLRRLPTSIRERIERDYQPTTPEPLWIRRGE